MDKANASEPRLHQNPLASALFKSKTHMTDVAMMAQIEAGGDNVQSEQHRLREIWYQNSKKSAESDPDITVENFEPTLSSRQVSHVSQHSGGHRPVLQMMLQPV